MRSARGALYLSRQILLLVMAAHPCVPDGDFTYRLNGVPAMIAQGPDRSH